jgi:nucleoside-diphosphate-sugar epimerase
MVLVYDTDLRIEFLKCLGKYTKNLISNNDKVTSIPKFLAMIIGKIFRIKILNKENIRHLCKERNYSINKIEALGFKQKYKLEDAIKKTINELFNK